MSNGELSKGVVVVAILFILALVAMLIFGNLGERNLNTQSVAILVMIGLVLVFLLPARFQSRVPGFKVGGVELQQVKEEVQDLQQQIYTIGQTAIAQQVSALNRLAVTNPELAQKTWKTMENLKSEEIKQLSYAYAFIDLFDMLRRFDVHDKYKEVYKLWREKWMPDLLASQTGELFKNHPELLEYYSTKTIEALNLRPHSK